MASPVLSFRVEETLAQQLVRQPIALHWFEETLAGERRTGGGDVFRNAMSAPLPLVAPGQTR